MRLFLLFFMIVFYYNTGFSAVTPDSIGEEIPLDDFTCFQNGYRIQCGVFGSEEAARAMMHDLQDIAGNEVSLHYESGLWKVRFGFYPTQSASNLDFAHLKLKGYDNLILVEDRIIPTNQVNIRNNKIEGYRIQVKALTDEKEALEYARKLNFQFTDIRTYAIKYNGSYRIQMGDFKTRLESEVRLQELKKCLDNGAWIVETYVYETPPPSPVERPQVDIFEFMD